MSLREYKLSSLQDKQYEKEEREERYPKPKGRKKSNKKDK